MANVAMPEHVLQVGNAHLEAWGPSETLQTVGKSIPKRPGFDKVTGRARYAFDVQLPGMLYGAIVRSTEARGRVAAIDTSAAMQIPGVRTILTPQNFPTLPGQGRPAIADQVRFVGEEIAAVAAETEHAAREAARAIKVRYEKYHAVIEPEEAMQPSAPQLTPTGNIGGGGPEIYERGSLQQGEAEADVVYEQRYATEVQHHNPLEPHGCVASWQGQELVLWDSNQGVHMVKDELAKALGLPLNHIRIINEHTGGGFGSKNGLKPYHVIAAVLSQRTGRPVRLFMNRDEEFIASHHRAKSRHIIRAGVKQDGTLTSIYHQIMGQAGPDPEYIRLAVAGADCTKHLYQCPNMKIELYKVLTNTQRPIPCRGPTAAEDLFCFEQFIDELAHMLKIEPLTFRLKNYAELDPVEGLPYSSKGLKACYEQGAKAFGWEWRPPRTVREGSKYRGIGLGSVVFHGTPGEQSEAMVVLHTDGTAQVVAGIAEIGVGAETVFAQIAAEELGIPVEHVSVSYGDSQTTPYTINSSYGSRTTTIAGPAVRAAAFEAKRQLLALAGRELGVAPEMLTIKDAQIVGQGNPPPRTPLREVTRKMGREIIIGVGKRHAKAEGMEVQTFGAHFAEVEVDAITGQVRVLRAVCAHDTGRWINPLLAESQIQGGFIQGMGMALYEERIMDTRIGMMLNNSMHEYFVPTILDTPAQLIAVDARTLDQSNSINVKGLGEPPLVGAGAAIANAIYNAIGVRIRHYPITPNKILTALHHPTAAGVSLREQ
jgi:xanthine dehydrogenase YagR molybdenum-binding subunit